MIVFISAYLILGVLSIYIARPIINYSFLNYSLLVASTVRNFFFLWMAITIVVVESTMLYLYFSPHNDIRIRKILISWEFKSRSFLFKVLVFPFLTLVYFIVIGGILIAVNYALITTLTNFEFEYDIKRLDVTDKVIELDYTYSRRSPTYSLIVEGEKYETTSEIYKHIASDFESKPRKLRGLKFENLGTLTLLEVDNYIIDFEFESELEE